MKNLGFFLIYTLIFETVFTSSNLTCCRKKVISEPIQYVGTYIYKRQFDGEKDENCYDGCIYSKEGFPELEYCFKKVETNSATIDDVCGVLPTPFSTLTSTLPTSTTADPETIIQNAAKTIV